MSRNYFIKSSFLLIFFFYAMLYGACLKKSNTTHETKQTLPLSNINMLNKGDSHVSEITNPLNHLLRDRTSKSYSQNERQVVDQCTESSINGTKRNKQVVNKYADPSIHIIKSNQEYSASNKEDDIREAENRCFITPEVASSVPQDVELTKEMLIPVNNALAHLFNGKALIKTNHRDSGSDPKISIKIDDNDPVSNRKIPIKIDGVEFYTKDLLALLHLNGNGWLTDNVIMAYMKMIENRSKKDETLPKVYIFDTVSYSVLLRKEYSKVQSWIKDGLSSYDRALMPIHLEDHWCLAVIDLRKNAKGVNTIQCIEYYDSLGGKDKICKKTILDYLRHEIKDYEMNNQEVVFEFEFKYKYQKDTKIQRDNSACGVFICKFADYATRNAQIDFNQDNIRYFRKRMAIEILKGDFL